MSRGFNHSKVNMQKRIAAEYRIYGDPYDMRPRSTETESGSVNKSAKKLNKAKGKRKKKR